MSLHKHYWRWLQRGTGVYKKGEQQIEVATSGTKVQCECGIKMFYPDNPRLKPVEVED